MRSDDIMCKQTERMSRDAMKCYGTNKNTNGLQHLEAESAQDQLATEAAPLDMPRAYSLPSVIHYLIFALAAHIHDVSPATAFSTSP